PPTAGTCPLSLHDALPISSGGRKGTGHQARSANDKAPRCGALYIHSAVAGQQRRLLATGAAVGQPVQLLQTGQAFAVLVDDQRLDRKSTRLNSSHVKISYA